jgi:3-hydroxypropanoate dehydrogenase
MGEIVNDKALDVIFRHGRSHSFWLDKPVSDVTLQAVYDLMRMGPTSANCSPARILFLKSREAKERLKPHLIPGNVEKVMTAPVTAVIGYDLEFYEHLPKLFPHNLEARSWFEGDERKVAVNAVRNGTLQGGYFILAARALGLDCGPMSGFDNAGVDRDFFPEGRVKSNFLCCLGYGDHTKLFPRNPRFEFHEVCRIL